MLRLTEATNVRLLKMKLRCVRSKVYVRLQYLVISKDVRPGMPRVFSQEENAISLRNSRIIHLFMQLGYAGDALKAAGSSLVVIIAKTTASPGSAIFNYLHV